MKKETSVNALKVTVKTLRSGKSEIRLGDKIVSTSKTGRDLEHVVEYHYKKITGNKLAFANIVGTTALEPKTDKFGINKRFEFVEQLVTWSLLVYSPPLLLLAKVVLVRHTL